MPGYKDNKFSERQSASENAKKAALEKFRARPAPDDPAVLARKAEQLAIAEARAVRAAERQRQRDAEAVLRAAEEVARQAELAKQAEEQRQRDVEAAARALALKAEQQAARDARYAARKARGRR